MMLEMATTDRLMLSFTFKFFSYIFSSFEHENLYTIRMYIRQLTTTKIIVSEHVSCLVVVEFSCETPMCKYKYVEHVSNEWLVKKCE